MLTPLHTCDCSVFGLFIAAHSEILFLIPLSWPPILLFTVFHTYCTLQFLAASLEHQTMQLASTGGRGLLGSLSRFQGDISSFKYRGVSPAASRGLSMSALSL